MWGNYIQPQTACRRYAIMVAPPHPHEKSQNRLGDFYAIGEGKKPPFRAKKGDFRGKTKKIAFFAKKICKNACQFKNNAYLCNRNRKQPDSVAQLVEQMTLNHWVESSSLSGVTSIENPEQQPPFRIFSFHYPTPNLAPPITRSNISVFLGIQSHQVSA